LAACAWTSHSLLGKPGNNPYCHYRALKLDSLGLRERITKVKEAPLDPFSIGEFELILEPKSGILHGEDHVHIEPPADDIHPRAILESRQPANGGKGRVPQQIEPCGACHQYVYPDETTCPHCKANLDQARLLYAERKQNAQALAAKLQAVLQASL
jgi:hypothetical protein